MTLKATLTLETFGSVIDELKPLLAEHWSEIALYRDDIILDPDYDAYARLQDAGVLRMFIVRVDGVLVGYAIYFVRAHLHYKKDKWALCDIIWIAPQYRRETIGVGLMTYVEKCLREEGVSVMHTTGKVEFPALAFMLEHMGHKHVEFGFSKLLKD